MIIMITLPPPKKVYVDVPSGTKSKDVRCEFGGVDQLSLCVKGRYVGGWVGWMRLNSSMYLCVW